MPRRDGWTRAAVGEHWTHNGYPGAVISTVRTNGFRAGATPFFAGYCAVFERRELGTYNTWKEATDAIRVASLMPAAGPAPKDG